MLSLRAVTTAAEKNGSVFNSVKEWFSLSIKSLFERREGQISSLDGLRAIAITLVVMSHSKNDFIFAGGKAQPEWLFWAAGYAWTGVDLFFVLSGFLIGKILLQELKRTGTVQVVPFLLKRGFRIWPLYYFICAVAFVRLLQAHALPPLPTLIPDLLFLTNYFKENLAFGSWSLAVEEQFYLIASVVILAFRKRISVGQRHIPIFLAGLLAIAPLIRMSVWNHYTALKVDPFYLEWDIIHNYIYTHYDGLAMGLIFASVLVFRPAQSWIRQTMGVWLTALVVLSGILTYFDRIAFVYSFATLIFGAAIWHCLSKPQSRFTRFLSWPGFQIISRLSYGMYLWYRFPLWRIAQFSVSQFPNASPVFQFFLTFAIDFVAAVALAAITYVLIERPFLELRSKLYRVHQA